MTLTDGDVTLTFKGEWIGQRLTPQNINITIGGNVRRQMADSRMGFTFDAVVLTEAECETFTTIFDNTTEQYLTLTLDRNPVTKTAKEYKVVFTSALQLKQEASAGSGEIAYYCAWKMEEVIYV